VTSTEPFLQTGGAGGRAQSSRGGPGTNPGETSAVATGVAGGVVGDDGALPAHATSTRASNRARSIGSIRRRPSFDLRKRTSVYSVG